MPNFIDSENKIVLESVLPISIPYDAVIKNHLTNSTSIRVSNAGLDLNPYFVFEFIINVKRLGKNKKVHRISDKGIKIVDSIDGNILYSEKDSVSDQIINSIFLKNKKEYEIIKNEIKQIKQDLETIVPIKEFEIDVTENYVINLIPKKLSFSNAEKIVIDNLIDEYSESISYKIKKARSKKIVEGIFHIIPRPSEVSLVKKELVYVPKWIITFRSGDMMYKRIVLASSNVVITDDLSICGKHNGQLDRILGRMKKSFAICEICGLTLCEDDSFKKNNSFYCKEHILNKI